MATKNHNLSKFDSPLPSAADMRFGIVVAEWNREVTEALLEGAVRTLRAAGCPDMNIQVKYVPGTFELSLGAQFFAEYTDVDAVIALGCVIQGDTRHFDFICQGVTQGITQLQIQWNMPIAFGVLTVGDMQQALDRCGGRHGNKGDEAAATAINMVKLQIDMEAASPDHEPDMRFGIVVAEWNREVTEALLEGAVRTLRAAGCPDMNIQVKYVPGTFELSLGAQFFAEYTDVDAVIALGCVIQGDTRHFDFICQGVTQGITQLQIQWNMPIAFGVLTVGDMQQALDRCGGRHGNKGDEAAATAINMVKLQIDMEAASPDHEPDRRNIN